MTTKETNYLLKGPQKKHTNSLDNSNSTIINLVVVVAHNTTMLRQRDNHFILLPLHVIKHHFPQLRIFWHVSIHLVLNIRRVRVVFNIWRGMVKVPTRTFILQIFFTHNWSLLEPLADILQMATKLSTLPPSTSGIQHNLLMVCKSEDCLLISWMTYQSEFLMLTWYFKSTCSCTNKTSFLSSGRLSYHACEEQILFHMWQRKRERKSVTKDSTMELSSTKFRYFPPSMASWTLSAAIVADCTATRASFSATNAAHLASAAATVATRAASTASATATTGAVRSMGFWVRRLGFGCAWKGARGSSG
jgi:hypothetical protein